MRATLVRQEGFSRGTTDGNDPTRPYLGLLVHPVTTASAAGAVHRCNAALANPTRGPGRGPQTSARTRPKASPNAQDRLRACTAVRLFAALVAPPPVHARLRAASHALAAALPGARLVPDASWHVTLAFLGDQPETQVEPITRALAQAAANAPAPEPLAWAGSLGAFPNPRHARVLWAGVAAAVVQSDPGTAATPHALESLASHCAAHLAAWSPDPPPPGPAPPGTGAAHHGRRFVAHATLARTGHVATECRRVLAEASQAALSRAAPAVVPHEVVLVASHLGTAGPRYAVVAAVPWPPGRSA